MRKSIKRWRGAPRATNPLPIIRGEKCPSANPPTTDSALHRSERKTGKADISTLQESGHFYLALTGWVEHSDTHQSLAWRRQWVSLRSTHPTRLFSGVFLRQLLLLHLRDIALQLHHDVAIRLDEFAAGAAFDFAAAVGHFEQAFYFDHRMDAADAG